MTELIETPYERFVRLCARRDDQVDTLSTAELEKLDAEIEAAIHTANERFERDWLGVKIEAAKLAQEGNELSAEILAMDAETLRERLESPEGRAVYKQLESMGLFDNVGALDLITLITRRKVMKTTEKN